MGAVDVATPIQGHDCVESRRHDSRADWVAPGSVPVARLRLRLEHVREQVRKPCHGEDAAREAVAQGERVRDPSLVRGLPEDERYHDENEGLHKKNERVQGLTSSEIMIMVMVMMVMILPHSRRDTRGLSQYGYITFFRIICSFLVSYPQYRYVLYR